MSPQLTSTIRWKDTDLSCEEYEADYMLYIDYDIWPRLLEIARSYGWRPAGTLPPKPFAGKKLKRWNGYYEDNCEDQLVTADDAIAIANALEKALEDSSDLECPAPKKITVNSLEDAEAYVRKSGDVFVMFALLNGSFDPTRGMVVYNPDLSPLEFFSGDDNQQVIDFVAFCRKG